MFKFLSLAGLSMAVFLLQCQAQVRVAVSGAPSRPVTGISFSGVHSRESFRGHSGMGHFDSPAWWGGPYYFTDYANQPGMTEAPPPQVVVIQAPAPVAEPAKETAKIEPLLIEWRDGDYVQVGEQAGSKETVRPENKSTASAPRSNTHHSTHPQPVPAGVPAVVLVYRDGHHEQVSNYTIANGILYVSGDYWTDGYWTRKVPLTALNLLATQQASQANGANFMLPGSPSEVIIDP